MIEVLHSKPWITAEDEAAVIRVLRSGFVGQGQCTRKFEAAIAGWFECEPAGIATGTGAAALQLALLALDCGPGAEVITPTYNCPTVLEAIVATGATPVLSDAGEDWRPSATAFASRITPQTRALIVPHLFGIETDLAPFKALGVPLIEDCAQIFGPRGRQKLEGTIAVFSFHATKCLTTGEGGMAVAHDARLAESLRALRDGIDSRTVRRVFSPMADPSAELGLAQLRRYEEFLSRRAEFAERYAAALTNALPDSIAWLQQTTTMHYRFPLRVSGGFARYGVDFLQRGIHVRRAVDRLLHRWLDRPDAEFPHALRLYEETLSLPIYPALTEPEFVRCIAAATTLLTRI